jgi:hypothetical protein
MTANKPTLQEWTQYIDTFASINAYTDAALRPARQPLTNIFIRSQFLQRTLGTRVAAGYLRNRKVSIETALYLLTRKGN